MTTENLTVMQGFAQKMGWIEKRQKVLAQNIANADTPGYRPTDVVPLDFKGLMKRTTSPLSLSSAGQVTSPKAPSLATTNPAHLNVNGQAGGNAPVKDKKQRVTYETAPAGNAVVLEEQLLKMGENYADHRLMTNLYQKNMDFLKGSLK